MQNVGLTHLIFKTHADAKCMIDAIWVFIVFWAVGDYRITNDKVLGVCVNGRWVEGTELAEVN